MKTFEIKWMPGGISWNYGLRTDIVQANSMEEALKMIEDMAKCYGATGIE